MKRITKIILKDAFILIIAGYLLSLTEFYYHESINKQIYSSYGINSTIHLYFGWGNSVVESYQTYWNASPPSNTFLEHLNKIGSFLPCFYGYTEGNESQLEKLNSTQMASLMNALEKNENYHNQINQDILIFIFPFSIVSLYVLSSSVKKISKMK